MIEASLKKLRLVTLVLLALSLALSPVGSAFAVGLGHGFYGTVLVNGNDAPEGTVISARVDGIEYGSCEVVTAGYYTGLIVQNDIDEGATIEFYVDDQQAEQTFAFRDGWTTELDLTVTTPTYALTMLAEPEAGGTATDETDESPYREGASVEIKAEASEGYRFVNWTAPAGEFEDVEEGETTFTMPAEAVTVTANFVEAYQLTMIASPEQYGDAIDVTDDAPYSEGMQVAIRAEAEEGYQFVNWTSDPEDILHDQEAVETFLTMPARDVTVTASFQWEPVLPTVTTDPATDITTYSALLSMIYTTGNYTTVDVRFAAKRATDATWFHGSWVSRTEDGIYRYTLTDLASQTEYEFKAQLRYNDTVIEGDVRRFTTGAEPTLGLGFLPCFIAPAAYGTPAAEEIDVLREFRDVVLLESTVGSQFVALYYRLSPPVADVISGNGFLRAVVRELMVDPVVWIVRATGEIWR